MVTTFATVHSAESSPSTQSAASLGQSREGQARALQDLARWAEKPESRWSNQHQITSMVRMRVTAEKATAATPSRQYARTTIDQQLLAMRDADDSEVELILSDKRVTPGTSLKIQADLNRMGVSGPPVTNPLLVTPPRGRLRRGSDLSNNSGAETPYGFGAESPVPGPDQGQGVLDEESPELAQYEGGERRAATARPHAPIPLNLGAFDDDDDSTTAR